MPEDDKEIISSDLDSLQEYFEDYVLPKPDAPKAVVGPIPEELIELAIEYFKWICERKEKRLALRRFSDEELKEEISNHAYFSSNFAEILENGSYSDPHLLTLKYGQFCDEKSIDVSKYLKKRSTRNRLLMEAALQFELIYHDILAKTPIQKFQFPMFEEAWNNIRPSEILLQASVSYETRNPVGRSGIDRDWLTQKFKELEDDGELPFPEGAWRTDIAYILLELYAKEYKGPKKKVIPKMETIRDKMKSVFDEYQAREQQNIKDIPNRRD